MAGAEMMSVVLSWIRLPAVARRSRMVTSESDEILAKHRFRVRLAGEARGYVRSWDVHVPPRQVEMLDDQPLSAQPAPTAARKGRATKSTVYAVLASHYGSKVGLWYRITTPGGDGWVAASRARARFSLPVVHFVAGMDRYQLGRYKDAAREFEQFTRSERATSDAPSLSTAYQLLGASQLMDISTSGRDVYKSSPEPARAFDRAIAVTPFDAGAYTLRAVSTLAVQDPPATRCPTSRRH